ncbi:MAG: iron-sulfur cluster assembly accessory protein [Chitinophagaceae bacterium]|nr:iron-sulfur cluster assembly accessory protein [Chitinophagaceae bacterium]
METQLSVPVRFTPGAVAEIKRLLQLQSTEEGKKLRIGVKGGGCSGLTYVLEFDKPGANDKMFEVEGIPCVMDKAHELYLAGMEIDWQEGLGNRGFTFRNPNASATCGCGSSFAV